SSRSSSACSPASRAWTWSYMALENCLRMISRSTMRTLGSMSSHVRLTEAGRYSLSSAMELISIVFGDYGGALGGRYLVERLEIGLVEVPNDLGVGVIPAVVPAGVVPGVADDVLVGGDERHVDVKCLPLVGSGAVGSALAGDEAVQGRVDGGTGEDLDGGLGAVGQEGAVFHLVVDG